MKLGGRIQAAIDVLEDVLERRTPATMALRDWGKAHRFAGSKDRSAIGNLVHDALRRKSSIGYRMGDDSARSLILGVVVFGNGHDPKQLSVDFKGDKFAPKPMSDTEMKALSGAHNLAHAPDWIQGNVPEWLWPAFENNFDDEAIVEGQALCDRPPLDLRVNTLQSSYDKAHEKLKEHGAKHCNISAVGLRINAVKGDKRLPNIQIEPVYQTGQVEIQDEGSQIVSLLIDAKPGETILDYCAGGGGKSLALAAEMKNEGAVHAFDIDKRRLAPLYQRAQRAGVNIIDVRQPPAKTLNDLRGNMDRVLVDAPCTGVGTWRRKPDTKWRLSPETLALRNKEQATVLFEAKDFVKPGGLLFYVTCSMLAEENEGQVYKFLEDNDDFTLLSAGEVWEEKFGTNAPKPWSADGCTLTLTPASTNTDGFFFAVMEKNKND